MEDVKLTLVAIVDGGACDEKCPFVRLKLPGGYSCALFGPLGMTMEFGPDSANLLGDGYPKRHDNCMACDPDGIGG